MKLALEIVNAVLFSWRGCGAALESLSPDFLALVFLDDESAVSDFLDLSDAESLDSL